MSGPQFYQTGYGRTFFEYQLPLLNQNLSEISKELKRANDLKERELGLEKEESPDGKESNS